MWKGRKKDKEINTETNKRTNKYMNTKVIKAESNMAVPAPAGVSGGRSQGSWWSCCCVFSSSGLWSLTYEQELTTPLHITAGRGFADCLGHLLLRGACVDFAPGGTTALHEACQECQPECVKLLLQYGANANAVTEDGLMPLHLCTEPESLEWVRISHQPALYLNPAQRYCSSGRIRVIPQVTLFEWLRSFCF